MSDNLKHMRKMSLIMTVAFGLVAMTLIVSVQSVPEEINGAHGYRTAFSKSSQTNWTLANTYFAKCMSICVVIGFLITLVAQNYVRGWWKIVFIFVMIILTILAPIAFTEMYLDGYR